MEGNKMSRFIEDMKRWGIALIIGGLLGGLIQQQFIIKAIEKDCKLLKSFRTYDKAYECKERA
jgi:hypothetical protein